MEGLIFHPFSERGLEREREREIKSLLVIKIFEKKEQLLCILYNTESGQYCESIEYGTISRSMHSLFLFLDTAAEVLAYRSSPLLLSSIKAAISTVSAGYRALDIFLISFSLGELLFSGGVYRDTLRDSFWFWRLGKCFADTNLKSPLKESNGSLHIPSNFGNNIFNSNIDEQKICHISRKDLGISFFIKHFYISSFYW